MKNLFKFFVLIKNIVVSVKFILFATALIGLLLSTPVIFPDDKSALTNNMRILSSRAMALWKPDQEKFIAVSHDMKGSLSSSGLHQDKDVASKEATQRCRIKSPAKSVNCITKAAFLHHCYATIRRTTSGAGAKIILGSGTSRQSAIRDGIKNCKKGNEVFESISSDGCEFTKNILCL